MRTFATAILLVTARTAVSLGETTASAHDDRPEGPVSGGFSAEAGR